ncbi:MAG: hypothetical protein LBE17_14910, partial [Treponema sp.]|nr:hypothetical protein [Treponema sp.]
MQIYVIPPIKYKTPAAPRGEQGEAREVRAAYLGLEPLDPGLEPLDPGLELLDPGLELQDPGLELQDPGL